MTDRKTYDPAADAAGCYAAAIEAKRRRGDTHYPVVKDRAPDPQTEREMKRLKRALYKRLALISPLEGEMSAKPTEGVARRQALAPSASRPVGPTPSGLPAISPSRGEKAKPRGSRDG